MELRKYTGDSDGSRLAATPIRSVDRTTVEWEMDNIYPENEGTLRLVARGRPPEGNPDDTYEVSLEPSELGVMLAAMRPEAVELVMRAFLKNTTPDILGAVAGCIVTHLARALAEKAR
jgi:hypothetical protein